MCSIYGAIGTRISGHNVVKLRAAAGDRGRDGHGEEWFEADRGSIRAVIGNWRATPTPEAEDAPQQPIGRTVFNGTIANDKELAASRYQPTPRVDTEVLAFLLNGCCDVQSVRRALAPVRGSYAFAHMSLDGFKLLLGTNYKPMHYWSPDTGGTVYFSSMEHHLRQVMGEEWRFTRPKRLEPYTVLDLRSGVTARLPVQWNSERVAVVCSSGLDSATVAWHYHRAGCRVELLHMRYGCHAGEREANRVVALANALGTRVHFIDLPRPPSTLTTAAPDQIADGEAGAEFAHEWVPARNLVMVAHAMQWAEAHGFGKVALGNNLEEAGAYPDNEEQFYIDLDRACRLATADGVQIHIEQPLGAMMKHEIVKLGAELKVPHHLTWSCYRGGEHHCGRCGPCFMRRTAFKRAGVPDPTTYETPERP